MENEFQPQEEVLDEHQSLNDEDQEIVLEEEKQSPPSQGGKKSFEEMDKEELLAETKRYYAIAKQKSKKPEPKKQEEIIKPQNSDITKEEIEIMFLQKDGFTEEEIEMLKTIKAGEISQGKSLNLIGASKHPLYEAYLNNKKTIENNEKAKLGASNKGGNFKEKKMTPEEHREFAKKRAQEILANM